MTDPLLTPAEAAERLGVAHATVCRWLREGAIESEPRGPKRRWIRMSTVNALRDPIPAVQPPTPSPTVVVSGVYFIAGAGLVKIGKADDIMWRLNTSLRPASPVPLALVAVIRTIGRDALLRERELHAQFAHLRQHYEWFTFAPEIEAFIAAHAERWEQ